MRKKLSITKKVIDESTTNTTTTSNQTSIYISNDKDSLSFFNNNNNTPPKLIAVTSTAIDRNSLFINEEDEQQQLVRSSKKGSISWECLPFSSKIKKQNATKATTVVIASNGAPPKKDKILTDETQKVKVQQECPPPSAISSNSSLSSSSSYTSLTSNVKTKQTEQLTTTKNNHHPYATSLVNSGFGFGFDLQGGEIDNQLTFIVNVQQNGDASRKGLIDGDILVSIQGKNVIGIRRTAIERILKQYKVDQEIEIVVCRLKDPSFILNLSKLITQQQKQQQQQLKQQQKLITTNNNRPNLVTFDTTKFRNLNEQIFNELITFQDTSSHSTTNMKKSIINKKDIYYEQQLSSSKLRQDDSDRKQVSVDNKSVLISVPINTTNRPVSAAEYNLNEANLISIELNKINNKLGREESVPRNNLSSIINSSNSSSSAHHHQLYDSGVYNESSRKSNKSTSYYSDISIIVYDNVANISSSINSGVNSATIMNTNDKRNTIIATSTRSSSSFGTNTTDNLVLLSLQQQQKQHRSSMIQPNLLSSAKSVNDFTGSIIAADRANYFNKQQQVAAAAKLNKNNDSLYSNVIKKEQRNRSIANPESHYNTNKSSIERIPICFSNEQQQMPLLVKESYETYRDAIMNNKKRFASEQYDENNAKTIEINFENTNVSNLKKKYNENVKEREPSKLTSVMNININNDNQDSGQIRNKKPVAVIVNELNSKFDNNDNLIVSSSQLNKQTKQSSSEILKQEPKSNIFETTTTTMSSVNKLNDCNLSSISNNANNYKRDSGQIEKRLLELEQIAKNNIEQLEQFEQKYSSSSLLSSLNNSKTVIASSARAAQSLFEIPISINLNENKSETNAIQKQTRLLEELNLKKPVIKQRLSTSNSNINKTNSLEEEEEASSVSSSTSSLSLSSSLVEPLNQKRLLQTSIDIEIYNLEPKSKQKQSLSAITELTQQPIEQRPTLTIMPRANRRSKQKPYKIECADVTIIKEQFKAKSVTASKILPFSIISTVETEPIEKEETNNLVKTVNEMATNAVLKSSSLDLKDENQSALSDNLETTKKVLSKHESYELTDTDEAQKSKKSSEDKPYSLLCGSLDVMINKEKSFKRRKPTHRHSQNSLTTNSQETQQIKTKKETISNRRDRRSRHTIPLLSYRSTTLKDDETLLTENKQQKPFSSSSSVSVSSDDNDNSNKNSLTRTSVENLISKTIENETSDEKTRQRKQKVFQWNNDHQQQQEQQTADEDNDSSNINPVNSAEEQNLNSFSANEQTFSDFEISSPIAVACSTEINSSLLLTDEIKLPTNEEEEEDNLNSTSNILETSIIEAVSTNEVKESKSDSETIHNNESNIDDTKLTAKRYSMSNTTTKDPIKSLRRKHDSTDTLDSASSYEIRFERPHFSLTNSKLDLEDKNILWKNAIINNNKDKKQEEEEEAESIVKQVNDELSAQLLCCTDELSKEEESLNQLNDVISSSSSSFRSVEVSPRLKVSNDDNLSDQFEMIKSITQIDQTISSISDTSNDVVNSIVDQIEMSLIDPIKCPAVVNTTATQSILDDGYGSTVSMKNATNESCSSLDDDVVSEISITSLKGPTEFTATKLKTKTKKQTCNKLESLIDDSDSQQVMDSNEITLVEEASKLEPEKTAIIIITEPTVSAELILEKTISFTSDLETKLPIEMNSNETNEEYVLVEEMENSMKLIELEQSSIKQVTIEPIITTEISEVSREPTSTIITDEQVKIETTNVEQVLEEIINEPKDEPEMLKSVLIEPIEEKVIIEQINDFKEEEDDLVMPTYGNISSSENKEMLQEPNNIHINNTSIGKHLNGSAFTETNKISQSAFDNIIKPIPVIVQVKEEEPIVSASSNVSDINIVQDDMRSLSSVEYTSDQALSQSYPIQYKSTIAPRQTVISRRSNNTDRSHHQSSNQLIGSAPISLRPVTSVMTASSSTVQSPAGAALKETRQREKKQLGELNDRFAGYVERVRFLEAQNKKLQTELSILKGKWGQETKQIEKMYQIELDEARSVLNDTSKNKDGLQIKLDKYEHELDRIRRKYSEVEETVENDKTKISYLQDQIAANESEIGLLRRRLTDLQDEEKRYKQEILRMMNEIQRVQFELENEMKQRLMLENDKQSLEEELVFLKEIHSKEIEELKHLSLQESGIDPTMFFKCELSNAIKEIREEYENLNQSQRAELEGWYRIKVAEIQRKHAQPIASSHESSDSLSREQARKLQLQVMDSKRNIGDLKAKNAELEIRIRDLEEEIKREESETNYQMSNKDSEIKMLQEHLNRIINEYEELMTTKSDLEVEIRTYRKLLEGEENKDGLKQIVENIEHRARGFTPNNRSFSNNGYISETTRSSPSSRALIPSSRSHDENISKINRGKMYSSLRRTVLESNLENHEDHEDSSVTEDVEEEKSSISTSLSRKADEYGQIELTIQYDLMKSKLLIKINKAKDLSDQNSFDSFVRILLLPDRRKRSKRKTKIIKDLICPQWDEEFEFDLSLAEAKKKSIDLLVKNTKSMFSRDKSFMGQCVIQLNSIENLENGITEWFQLQNRTLCDGLLKKLLD